jgi:hypothetical protein
MKDRGLLKKFRTINALLMIASFILIAGAIVLWLAVAAIKN